MSSKMIDIQDALQGTLNLYTESFGEAKKGTCVLIAGALASGRFWTDSFCESLSSEGYLVIRYDHRDIGLSSSVDWNKAAYTLADLAADALAILDGYGKQNAYFVGHSMGGYVCQQLALDAPERIVGFTAIASGPLGATKETDTPLTKEEQATLEHTWNVLSSRKKTDRLEEKIKELMAVWRSLNGVFPFDETLGVTYTMDLLTHSPNAMLAGNSHEYVMREIQGSLPCRRHVMERINIPTLILHGTVDPLFLPREGKALSSAIKGACCVMVPGMGHMLCNKRLEQTICGYIQQHMRQ